MSLHHYRIAFTTIMIKEMRRFLRIWVQTILPPMITTALYFVIFGKMIGSQLAPVEGFEYMDYIVPGLIMMTVITNSYANVVSSFYGSKFQRYVEELLIAPIPHSLILLGFISGGVARGLIVGVMVTLVAAFFVDLQLHNLFITLSVVVLTSFLFALGGFINAVYAKSFDDISIIPTFVLTPLTYLGGIFYSVSMLPEFWQDVSLANPILYMVNAFRYGMLGVSDISMPVAYAVIVGFIVVLYSFSLWLLKRGVGLRG
ncbi:MAG: ABC transporter permease [Gammaproteobacteria bacterium]|nr:ABC transporter permease [Gammaproteobacteria bacterium]MCW8928094.1 ABC transporter permease [Gammaproteobacteria bacterium]MCW8958387.1 ABC transporter permease [Gammaproteobacteria bacterium]MCW8972797.1 ABC transporter permease [Gammaproteobacteria bacterium]